MDSPLTLERVPGQRRALWRACEAVVRGDQAACQAAPASREALNDERSCVQAYWDMRLGSAIVRRDPKVLDVCMTHNTVASTIEDPAERRAMCSVWVEKRDPRGACVQFAAHFEGLKPHVAKQYIEECSKTASLSLAGTLDGPEDCTQFGDGEIQRQFCPAMKAYRAAYAAKDAALCEGRPLCRALMGEAAACREDLDRQLGSVCEAELAKSQAAAAVVPDDGLVAELERAVAGVRGRPLAPEELAAARRLDAALLGEERLLPSAALDDAQALYDRWLAAQLSRARALLAGAPKDSPLKARLAALADAR